MLQRKLIKETVKCNIEQSWEAHYLIMCYSLLINCWFTYTNYHKEVKANLCMWTCCNVTFSPQTGCFFSFKRDMISKEEQANLCPCGVEFVLVIAWLVVIFGINTTSDISKLLHVISRTVRRVKFETILKHHECYLCQISRTNHAIICLYYYPQEVCNFHM